MTEVNVRVSHNYLVRSPPTLNCPPHTVRGEERIHNSLTASQSPKTNKSWLFPIRDAAGNVWGKNNIRARAETCSTVPLIVVVVLVETVPSGFVSHAQGHTCMCTVMLATQYGCMQVSKSRKTKRKEMHWTHVNTAKCVLVRNSESKYIGLLKGTFKHWWSWSEVWNSPVLYPIIASLHSLCRHSFKT